MSTDPKEYQKSRKPWSKWKHAILLGYLKAMAAILRRRGCIYYVDGFAGPGKYVEDESVGSPILAARHAKDLAYSGREYALRCINVEQDPDVFQNLENSTAKYQQWVENLYGELGDHVPSIVDSIGDLPALFFLDPIGIKGLEWSKLLPVLRRQPTTEILIRFHADAALRLAGPDVRHHATLNAILGEDTSEYWKSYLATSGNSSHARRQSITEAYENKLRASFDYVAKIPIKDSEERFKYFLLFASRSLKGVQAMNDVIFNVNGLRDRVLDGERRARETSHQMTMFEVWPEIDELTELNELKSLIFQTMETGETFRRDDLRAKVALSGDNFGRFAAWQFTAVLGGRRNKKVPKEFESMKSRIIIHNDELHGSDYSEMSLQR